MELRHHDIKNYLGKGIKDPVELTIWTDSITTKMDKWNEEGEQYEGQNEDLINELLQFSNLALRAIRFSLHKDKDYIARLTGRIAQLERRIKYLPQEPKQTNPTKKTSPRENDKKEIERIASLLK